MALGINVRGPFYAKPYPSARSFLKKSKFTIA